MTIQVLPLPPTAATPGESAPATATRVPAGGLLPAAPAALFVDLLRAFGALPVNASVGAAEPVPADDADILAAAADGTVRLDVALPSQSSLAAALHAVGRPPLARGQDATEQAGPTEQPAPTIVVMPTALPPAPAPLLPATSNASSTAATAAPGMTPVGPATRGAATPLPLAVEQAAAEMADVVSQPVAVGSATPPHGGQPTAAHAAADTVLKLSPAAPDSWQQPLTEALGERLQLQLQLGKQGERAVIRLDPPMLGRVDIVVQHDAGGALQVHLSASNGEVLRQLHAIGDSLRLDLGQRQHGDVTVVVADASRDTDGRSRSGQQQGREEDTPGDALDEAQAGFLATRFALPSEGKPD